MVRLAALAAMLAIAASPALASALVEPHMGIARGGTAGPEVALTLDACMGAADGRILDELVRDKIAATVFVTGRWLKRNPTALGLLEAHPDLFEIEDHGLDHLPAVIGTQQPYGLKPAGTAAAIIAEIGGGADAILAATHVAPHWYRDATALYSPDALTLIGGLGYRVAGFSLNADFGATASEARAAKRLESARDGDVIIAHVNQPRRPAGAGIAEGIAALKARGYRFVRLMDVAEVAE